MHPFILSENLKAETGSDGFVPSKKARPTIAHGQSQLQWLAGDQYYVFYEVLLRGVLYRCATDRSGPTFNSASSRLRPEGWLLPTREAVPNTPTALATEIAIVAQLAEDIVINEGYDFLRWRLDHWRGQPIGVTETGLPADYLLKNLYPLCFRRVSDGTQLLQMPKGVAPANWNLFLTVILESPDPVIDEFVSSPDVGRLVSPKLREKLVPIARAMRPRAITGRARGIKRLSEEMSRLGVTTDLTQSFSLRNARIAYPTASSGPITLER